MKIHVFSISFIKHIAPVYALWVKTVYISEFKKSMLVIKKRRFLLVLLKNVNI